MNRRALVLLAGLLAVVGLGGGVFFFRQSGASEDQWPVDPEQLGFYRETYAESREAFRQSCARLVASAGARATAIAVPSDSETNLTIDVCYVPPTAAPKKLLILTSGVHGIEAFAGSAVQRYFLDRVLLDLDRRPLGVLAVHAVNPYGFQNERRVTENNVDLNRNHDTADALFQSQNEGYTQLYGLLNPEAPVELGSLANRFFFVRAVTTIAEHSMGALRQAILQGQYTHPKGIYFGGRRFEPQRELLKGLFQNTAAPYRHVLLIDLHTGYGERGRLHFFPNAIRDPLVKDRIETVFAGYRIDYGDTEDFYTTTGDFSEYVGKLLADKAYIPMVFEYGTLDSQTTSGSIQSIHNVILENQGKHYGYVSAADMLEVKRRFREGYFPSSPQWRSKVLRDSDEALRTALPRFIELDR